MAWSVALPALASVAGGLISSDATSKAADQQAAATGKAVDETKREYDTSRADLAPYRQAGVAALGRLRTLLGIVPTAPGGQTTGVTDGTNWWANMDDARNGLIADYVRQGGNPDNNPEYQKSLQSVLDTIQPVQPQSTSSDTGSLLSKFSTADLNADPVYNSGLQFGLDEGTKAIERRAAANGSYDSGATLKELTRFGNDYGSQKAGDAYARFTNDQNSQYGKLMGLTGVGTGATNTGVAANTTTGSNLASLYSGQGNAAGAATIAGANAIGTGINNAGQYALLSQLQGGGARSLRPTSDLTGASDLGATSA